MSDQISALDRLAKTDRLAFQLETDRKGYFDKECPSPACLFRFKLKAEDWFRLESGSHLTCPMCGHRAAPNHWYTTEQVEKAQAKAIAVVEGMLGEVMQEWAEDFNRQQSRNSFLRMTMRVTGSSDPRSEIDMPIEAAEAMELEIECEPCATRFAVIGSAFFCPGCGHNCAERMFDDALRKITVKLQTIDVVREAVEHQAGKDAAAMTARSMLESCLPDGVMAFQKHCEALYAKLPGVRAAPFNAFQRLKDGSDLWKVSVGAGYEDWLLPEELTALSTQFQRRHLLSHAEGIVDAKYISNTGDTAYTVGQRIVVRPQDVQQMVDALAKIAQQIRAAVA